MKKIIGLLSAITAICVSENAHANFPSLKSKLSSFAGSIKNNAIVQNAINSETGKAVHSFGKAVVNYGVQQVNAESVNLFANSIENITTPTKNNAIVLHNELVSQIQLMDAQPQTKTDPSAIASEQQLRQAATQLEQLITLLSMRTTNVEQCNTVLQQSPILAQQISSTLSGTAYAPAVNNLIISINSMDASLTKEINDTENNLTSNSSQTNTIDSINGSLAEKINTATTNLNAAQHESTESTPPSQ